MELEIEKVVQLAFAGDADAARRLHDRFGNHLRRVIRKRLHGPLRQKFDSLDFMQDVWASFFVGGSPDRCFDSPEELFAYLVQMAEHKVIDALRKFLQTKKYDLQGEKPLFDSQGKEIQGLAAAQQTPSGILMDQEAWERHLANLLPVHRRCLILYRDGHTPVEIAEIVGISKRTVERVIAKTLHGESHG